MTSDQSTAPNEKSATGFSARGFLRTAFVSVCGVTILGCGALIMLAVAVGTLFQTRRFCAEVIARKMGSLALQISGVRLVVHGCPPIRDAQTVYISNHTSTLDLFAVIALGLPDTRYFLSGFLRKIVPLGLIGYLIGVFWTAPLRFPDKRRKIFQNAERTLRRTGASVYLTPEGSRITTGNIAHFNRGAFHLATNLQADIMPIFLCTTHDSETGMDLVFEPGVVNVYFLPTISTKDWKVEDLDQNRDLVRNIYVDYNSRVLQSTET